jgi:hypothetical protein
VLINQVIPGLDVLKILSNYQPLPTAADKDTPMPTVPPPSLKLLRRIKAHFIANGTTLAEWCRANNQLHSNVRQAILGSWNGPKGSALRAKLCREAGIRAEDLAA